MHCRNETSDESQFSVTVFRNINKMDFKELLAYKKAFSLAMEIKKVSDSFPKEEKYALTD